MEHEDALERIEIAAAEPDGLERLMAGDTADAAVVAGHLAGCPACVAELVRIRRTAVRARAAVADLPDPALKERTLAFVRAVGRERTSRDERTSLDERTTDRQPGAPAVAAPPAVEPDRNAAVADRAGVGGRRDGVGGRRAPGRAVLAGLLAASIVVGLGGFLAGTAFSAPAIGDAPAEIAVLADATLTALRIGGRADAIHVNLAPAPGGPGEATASLVLSPSDGELVMVASGLPSLADGAEYGCWVEVAGERRQVGELYAGGDLQAWAGQVDGLAELPTGAVFGISLRPADGAQPVVLLTGTAGG